MSKLFFAPYIMIFVGENMVGYGLLENADDSRYAWNVNFNNGNVNNTNKNYNEFWLRALFAF